MSDTMVILEINITCVWWTFIYFRKILWDSSEHEKESLCVE